jgi:hypothetical protein
MKEINLLGDKYVKTSDVIEHLNKYKGFDYVSTIMDAFKEELK